MEEIRRINRVNSLAVEPNAQYPAYYGQGDRDTEVLVDEKGRKYTPEFFSYPITFNMLAATPFEGTGTIQIQSDADFIINQTEYSFIDDTVPNPTVLARFLPSGLRVQLTDSGSARNLINAPVPIPTLFGDGLLPFILPTPKRIAASSVLTVTISSNGLDVLANASTLALVFTGVKRYFY